MSLAVLSVAARVWPWMATRDAARIFSRLAAIASATLNDPRFVTADGKTRQLAVIGNDPHATRRTLESDVAAIDACGFSSPFRPVALDPADPTLVDVLHPGDAAWATVTDPRATTAVVDVDPAAHGRHLAEYLARVL